MKAIALAYKHPIPNLYRQSYKEWNIINTQKDYLKERDDGVK